MLSNLFYKNSAPKSFINVKDHENNIAILSLLDEFLIDIYCIELRLSGLYISRKISKFTEPVKIWIPSLLEGNLDSDTIDRFLDFKFLNDEEIKRLIKIYGRQVPKLSNGYGGYILKEPVALNSCLIPNQLYELIPVYYDATIGDLTCDIYEVGDYHYLIPKAVLTLVERSVIPNCSEYRFVTN
jgi:hypothetical protein